MDYFHDATHASHFEGFISENPQIEFVRHVYIDFSGIVRMRILTVEYSSKLYRSGRSYGCGPALMMFNVSGTSEAKLPRPVKHQKFDLVPDWTSLRVCEFAPAHAWVMCFVRAAEETADPFFVCPKFLLAKVLERARAEADLDVLIGFEIEFTLLDSTLQVAKSLDVPQGFNSASGLRDEKVAFFEEVVRALRRSRIGVTHFHVECFHELEIATDPFPPMEAVDNLIYTLELIRTIALRHGYKATMSILPVTDDPTGVAPANQLQPHFSISKKGPTADHFLAGILTRVDEITPFAMSSYDSYLNPFVDHGGYYASWGTENRDVVVRRVEDSHWEFRISDATNNFYLTLAVMLSAGLDGIRDKTALTWGDLRLDFKDYTKEELAALGVTKRLPTSLRLAVDVLRESEYLEGLLGKEMKSAYILVKDTDERAFSSMREEEKRLQFIKHF
ncbi:hypothetical protein M409DRAFT_18737 [Zasmidium cellare ATCC 36951]|uniref:Glutamine synthetase n=1 Tax=Zasmidium cellare ATCC 36951 TaxID=1080233 RepID=A0A6A6CUD4_ZASCE|nr:uncharacterized protein M409DRAFT_18737 [Zasmidium cellare ATCC 36951]KAF2170764.1 hypothetical protein M409DRAFT_18737 [Zasmidium cellare ATCC 36951]